MKRTLALFLALVMCLPFVACGGGEDEIETSKETATLDTTTSDTTLSVETEQPVLYSLGDSVETDILKITLINAQLAVKVKSSGTYSSLTGYEINDDYFTADEYDPINDVGLAYVAPKGHTYVVIQFKAENLDRASVEFDGVFNDRFIYINYNGNNYMEKTTYGCNSSDGINWKQYNSMNVLLLAGKKEQYRCFVDIPTEANSLKDDFEITFALPKSDGTTQNFSYHVTSEDIDAVASQEISLERAIQRFTEAESLEYFRNHMDEFNTVSGEEFKLILSQKSKWNVDYRATLGYWSGKYQFEDSGRIKETIFNGSSGYFNDRTWSINGNEIILKSGKKQNICEIRKVLDGVYLLTVDGNPYLLLH